jgi:hypothetical protein
VISFFVPGEDDPVVARLFLVESVLPPSTPTKLYRLFGVGYEIETPSTAPNIVLGPDSSKKHVKLVRELGSKNPLKSQFDIQMGAVKFRVLTTTKAIPNNLSNP